MTRNFLYIAIVAFILIFTSQILFAGGDLVRLKAVGDSMASMEEARKKEDINYQKAASFINGPEIKQGLTKDFISKKCGEPVATVKDGTKWVYKPSASTFFKGEKLYFIFDKEGKLLSWESVRDN